MNDIEALTEAAMSEAGRDRDRLLKNAEATAREIRDRAVSESMVEKDRIIAAAESEAARAKEQARAAARLEAQQITLSGRESLLTEVFDAAADRLGDTSQFDDYEQVIQALLRDAVAHLDNVEALVVLADPVARDTLSSAVLKELGEELGVTLLPGDPLTEGVGVIVQSRDGRVTYDNTLQQRLARQRSALRADVFAILKGRDV